MKVLLLLYSFALPWLVGYLLLTALSRGCFRLPRKATLVLAMVLGWSILTHGMLALHILGIKFTWMSVTLWQLIIAAGLTAWIKRPTAISSRTPDVRFIYPAEAPVTEQSLGAKIFIVIFWAFAAYFTWHMFWRALTIPVYAWDSMATSIANAKIFFVDGDLAKLKWVPYSIYPLHVPLLCVWTSLCLGEWHDQSVKIIFPVAFLALSTIYYVFLRCWTGRNWAILGVLLLWSANLFIYHATISYRDIMLSLYTLSGLLLLVLWSETKQMRILLLAGIVAGMATFVKLEGTVYMAVPLALTAYLGVTDSHRRGLAKLKPLVIVGVPCVVIFLFYYLYKWSAGISTVSYINPDIWGALGRVRHSAAAFFTTVFLTSNWNINWVWLLFALAFHPACLKSIGRVRLLAMALALFLGLHFAVSLVMGIAVNMISHFTLSRLFIHFFPLVPLLVVLITADAYRRSS